MPCTWMQQLLDARDCGLPGVILSFNTSDRIFTGDEGDVPMSLRYFLAEKLHSAGVNVGHYSCSGGFSELVPGGATESANNAFSSLRDEPEVSTLFRNMGKILRNPKANCTILLEYASHLVPHLGANSGALLDSDRLMQLETLHEWSLDDSIRRSGNFLVLINHSEALNGLIDHQGGFRTIQIGLPDEQARLRFAEYITQPDCIGGTLAKDFALDEFARLTNGLRLRDIEQLFRESAARHTAVDRGQVREHKKQAIHQLCGGLLEVAEPGDGFESVAGCYHAKAYFEAIKPLWIRGHKGLPQAVLLAGVPGAGKSFLIKAVAKEFDVPCLVMRGVREMWVGQSERNLDRILQVVSDLAPCILWTDEIDQTLGGERSSGASGDSGTNERMLGRLLEFFGDSSVRGRVLWIASTNRPDLLDVAIKDRFSIKIPFLHPNGREREELLPILARQIGRRLATDVDCSQLAAHPALETLTIRSLQEVIAWAGVLADMDSAKLDGEITSPNLEKAIGDYKPTFDPLEHELIALISLQMTSFLSMMPWMSLTDGFDAGKSEWPAYLDGLIDEEAGHIDSGKLEGRIREIRRIRTEQRLS